MTDTRETSVDHFSFLVLQEAKVAMARMMSLYRSSSPSEEPLASSATGSMLGSMNRAGRAMQTASIANPFKAMADGEGEVRGVAWKAMPANSTVSPTKV